MDTASSATVFRDTRPHYELLDALRGVAALMVIWYHVFEGFATSPADQKFNHGYLAVDFFFLLSGFVMSYAYDDRWGRTMGTKEFFLRRLIRLHPMVVTGVLLGAVTYCIQGCVKWDGTHTALSMVMLAVLLNLFMVPAVPGTGPEVRGYGEMFPLNGPNWSLFFEYIGNIIYALLIRRLPTKALAAITLLSGAGLAAYAVCGCSGYSHLGVGWTLAGANFPGGMLRMLFAFSAGMLISRTFRPVKIRGAFWICSVALAVLLSMPYALGTGIPVVNGIYDSACVLLIFPLLVYLGASGSAGGKKEGRLCRFLGDVSYPVYVIHYPFMYLFYAWLWKDGGKIPFSEAWPYAVLLFAGSVILSWILLKVYDLPVRKWLSSRLLRSGK